MRATSEQGDRNGRKARCAAAIGRVGAGAAAVGVACAAYDVYDLAYPNHDVGDMYGLEAMVRLVPLGLSLCILMVGALLLYKGCMREGSGLRIAGSITIMVPALALVFMALVVAYDRWQDQRHETYPSKSVEELVRIVVEEKDQFAVYALALKNDPASVAALARILLDDKERVSLRICAAQGLGQVGGPEARRALEQARDAHPDLDVATHVGYALESLDARRKTPAREGARTPKRGE